MSSNKKITDLTDYLSVLPYASEVFGIYQPLLGWKSKRMQKRFFRAFQKDRSSLIKKLQREFNSVTDVQYIDQCDIEASLKPGTLLSGQLKSFDSKLLEALAQQLPPYEMYDPAIWKELITNDKIEEQYSEIVIPKIKEDYRILCEEEQQLSVTGAPIVSSGNQKSNLQGALEHQLKYESSIGGALVYLAQEGKYNELKDIFYNVTDNKAKTAKIGKILSTSSAHQAYMNLDNLDPTDKKHLEGVGLSPISVVHLFRQYFFELDTFLGTPVGHVWLSPGASAELIEIHTRKTVVEKTIENTFENIVKAEQSTTEQDELSTAIKEDNKQAIKFGMGVSATYGPVTASSVFDYNSTQQMAREQTHKKMRKQSDKLSTEIRKNYKSTFKTVTETTDTSSKRYVLANNTSDLINYEMRRKMRQVGVQVQDIGTYLCWQSYVDRPGEDLGVSKLVHIAKPADVEGMPKPNEQKLLQPFTEDKTVTFPFISKYGTDADKEGEVYVNGVEAEDNEVAGNLEIVEHIFEREFVCELGNYTLKDIEFDAQSKPISVSRLGEIKNVDNKGIVKIKLDSVNFQGQDSVSVMAILHWAPTDNANQEIINKNKASQAEYDAKEEAVLKKSFIENAKERIKLASKIKTRKSEELREEERIVIYRKLIQDLLTNGVEFPDDRTRHIVAELINSIFDVDKMLYFVAPEWWRPRRYKAKQQLMKNPFGNIETGENNESKLNASAVGWGGLHSERRDNYYITEDSDPAKLGSSLGWLLQLDGDNMRNAFLNAPWVKAVIPIRPGKEAAAINWLKGVEGFNGIEDNDIYQTNNPDELDIDGNPLNGQKMIDVIMDLAKKIQRKHKEGIENGLYPKQNEIANPDLVDEGNIVTSTPVDRVYEHGFYPLKGGFRANVSDNYEIFDQWIEVLPTDQVVPVEVKYDPKTGRQI